MSGDVLNTGERCRNATWLEEFTQGCEEDMGLANLSRAPLASAEAQRRFVVATGLGNACTRAPDCLLGPEESCPINKPVVVFAAELGFEEIPSQVEPTASV